MAPVAEQQLESIHMAGNRLLIQVGGFTLAMDFHPGMTAAEVARRLRALADRIQPARGVETCGGSKQ
jgi:hypothetical protein